MNEEVIIICPEIVPGSGGLADYTRRVVEQWQGRTPLRFILPAREGSSPSFAAGSKVDFVQRRRAALREKLPDHGGKVLLQYSAYGFDNFGYPRWLLQALTDWKASVGGLLVVMLHETWTIWPVLNRNYLIQQLHRRDLRTLIGLADSVFTSTASQAEHLRELDAQVVAQVLPVGANIMPGEHRADREAGLAVLFGLQASRLRTLRLMETELKSLASAALLTKLVTMGGGNRTEGDAEEMEILHGLPLSGGAECAGCLADEEVSAWLGRASFGICAQEELSLTKSGTFMACAAHGLNILSPIEGVTKSEPLCWLTRSAELLRGLSEDELRSRAESLRAWQERTSSWPAIAERFAVALSL